VPKVSVYLPDELYRRAREQGLRLSALTQAAVERELERDPNARWIAQVADRPARCEVAVDTSQLVDEVREAFGR
jgi:post-segregation antitoxin (ccd killing protein)